MPQQRQRAPPWERWKLFRAAYLLARPGAVRDLRWRWMATAAAASAEANEARFTALAGTLLGVRVGEHAIHGQQLSRLLREIFAALVSESRHVVDLRELVVALVILHGASSESNESVRDFLWQMYDEQNRGWISKAQAASLLWSLASSRRSAHHLANAMQDLKTKVKSAELKELLPDHFLSICRVDAQSPHDRASHALKVGIDQAQQLKGRTELLQTQRTVRHMQQYRLRARFCTWRAHAQYERIVRTSMRIGQTHARQKGAAKAFDRLRDYVRARLLLAGQSQRASVLAQRHLLQRSVRQWLAWRVDQVFRRSIRQRAFTASYQRGFRRLERAVTTSLSIKLEKRFWTWQNLWKRARQREEEEEEEEKKGEKRRAK